MLQPPQTNVTELNRRFVRGLGIYRGMLRPITIVLFLAATCSFVAAQPGSSPTPLPTAPPISADNGRNESRTLATMEEEMRAKRAIHSADKAYKENLNRAKDLATIGASLCDSFEEKKYLSHEDIKKLDRAEKLTKGIRDAAGGSGADDITFPKPPKDIAAAMTRLSDLTESLKEKVEKTPKRVISAAVIDEANVLLELIRIVRGMQPKT